MSYDFGQVDMGIVELPIMAKTDLGKWVDMEFDLTTMKVLIEERPWNKEAKVPYCKQWTFDSGWAFEEIPHWVKALWKDFVEANADNKGQIKCKYMRTEIPNPKEKGKFHNQGEFEMQVNS